MDQPKPSKKALHRKQVLDLAKKIGISAACEKEGMDRTSYYKWRNRFDELGLAGLEDRPPIRREATTDITDNEKATIISFARENPEWGCERIAEEIGKKSRFWGRVDVGKSTVHEILAAIELSTRTGRWLDLEERLRQSAALATTATAQA